MKDRGSKKRKRKLILPREPAHRMLWLSLFREQLVSVQNFESRHAASNDQGFLPPETEMCGRPESPHRWFLGNWAARVKKEFPVLHLHLSPLSSPVLYHHWYLGWHFNTHVKKLKAVRKDVVLQGAPSVLTRLKNKKKKKTAKLLLR